MLMAMPGLAQGGSGTGGTGLGEIALFGEELTVQAATKTEIPISKAPGSVSVITAQQIRESGAQSIPELLRLVAGVNVRWNPMVQTIDIRGFGQNPFTSRVLLLIDGVPYNSWNKGGFPQHPGFDFFMLQNIKRIEILRGPGSALYGENAYWGVINIVSISGEDLEGGKIRVAGGDLLSQSLDIAYGKSVGKGSFLVSGRLFRGQLPVRFWFDEADSEVEGSDIQLKGTYGNVEFSYYRHEDDVEGFNQAGFIPGTRFRSAEEISQTVDIFALKFSHEWNDRISFAGDVSFAQREGSRCASCHAAPQNPAFENTVDHGSQLIGDFRINWKPSERHDLLLGVEGRRVDTGDHTDELLRPEDTTADVVLDYTKFAAYVQDQISFADDRFRLTLGARFDGSNDLFDSEISPRLAAVYTPNDRVVLRGGWSTAFRFPNFSELYQNSWFLSLDFGPVATPFQVFQPNPELEPEQIRTIDIGGDFRLNPTTSLKVDLFHSEVKDFMVLSFNGGGPTRLQVQNHPDDGELFGAEVELRFRPSEKFTGVINYSYQETDRGDSSLVTTDGRPLELVYAPENKVNLGAYFGPFAGFRGSIEAQWRDERLGPSFWNFASGGRQPGVLDSYTLLNLKLSWDAPVSLGRAGRGLRLSVYGKNLLDEDDVSETFLPINMNIAERTVYGAIEILF
jgi:iron complex outermembrane receptor protein